MNTFDFCVPGGVLIERNPSNVPNKEWLFGYIKNGYGARGHIPVFYMPTGAGTYFKPYSIMRSAEFEDIFGYNATLSTVILWNKNSA